MSSRSSTEAKGREDGPIPVEDGPILVGRVIRPHGLRGEVRIEIHSDVPDRFKPGRELLLRPPGDLPRSVRVTGFRPIRGGGVIRFAGCETRDQAAELRRARLEVDRSQIPAAPAGRYYYFELVGCRCVDAQLGELGEVTAVVEDGGGVLLEVRSGDRILPVPFVEAFLEEVDVDRRLLRLKLPPGLIETCASKS